MSIDVTVYKVDYKNVDGKQHIKLEEINTYHNGAVGLFLNQVANLAEMNSGCFKEVDIVELIQAQINIREDIALYEKRANKIDLKKVKEVIEKKEKEFAELTGDKDFINLANNSIIPYNAQYKVNNNDRISDTDKYVYTENVSLLSTHDTYIQEIAKSYQLLKMIDEIIKGMGVDEEEIKEYNELNTDELADSYGEHTCMVSAWY